MHAFGTLSMRSMWKKKLDTVKASHVGCVQPYQDKKRDEYLFNGFAIIGETNACCFQSKKPYMNPSFAKNLA